MTRVLVVNREPVAADLLAGRLRESGFEVETCAGPSHGPCPVMRWMPCTLVDRADVLVYDATVGGGSEAGRELVRDIRETYVDLPVVLTSVDEKVDWVETEGPYRVIPLPGLPARPELAAAVESALEEQGMAV